METRKKAFLGMASAVAMAASAFSGVAHAWEPTKPIDFVIMAGAGGGADQIARFIQSVAEKNDLTPRPLIPNNKGGGSGAEALIALNGSKDPDHSILVTLNSFFTTPLETLIRLMPGRRPSRKLMGNGSWAEPVRVRKIHW